LGDPAEHEKLIENYLRENDTEAAVQLLVNLIEKNAREKKFGQAESLRERLFEIDAMALNEIVKTGEIIEAARNSAIDEDHLNTWADIYAKLTREEANSLFYGMKLEQYPASHMIFRQGEMRSRLYLIDEGRLKMFYRQGDKAIFLKTLGPGDLFGEDSFFFSDAFCTTSIITDSKVKLRVLIKSDLDKIGKKTPGLEAKLNDYCRKLEPVADLLKTKNLERRVDKRFNLSGRVMVQMLDAANQKTVKPFRGELVDISASGLAFLMKTTQKASSVLLGRNLKMKLTFDELASDLKINCIGMVVAVNSEPFNEYVIHAEFDKNLSAAVMGELEDLKHPEEE
jgi:CRP-like cAMP-binding protein